MIHHAASGHSSLRIQSIGTLVHSSKNGLCLSRRITVRASGGGLVGVALSPSSRSGRSIDKRARVLRGLFLDERSNNRVNSRPSPRSLNNRRTGSGNSGDGNLHSNSSTLVQAVLYR